jgi:hypothetical protein
MEHVIVNHLLIRLKDRQEEAVQAAREVLLGMEGRIPALHAIRVELPARQQPSNYDLMLIATYFTWADFENYKVDPVHLEVSRYIGGVIENAASFCYETVEG